MSVTKCKTRQVRVRHLIFQIDYLLAGRHEAIDGTAYLTIHIFTREYRGRLKLLFRYRKAHNTREAQVVV